MPEETLLVTRTDAVLTLTINRPHRKNALDDATIQLLHDQLADAGEDARVRAVVLTGAGGDFCSGADVGSPRRAGHPVDRMRWLAATAALLIDLPKPVIAQVSGVAVGAGCNLAIAADFVVCTPDARFSQIFARRGLSPDFGGTWLLPRTVGLLQAKRLALLAEIIDADEALRIGLVTWVRPAEEIDRFVDDLASQLVAGPPVALAQTKAMLNQAATQSLQAALDNEGRAAAVNLATDAMAARQAYVDRAEPVFDGRWRLDTTVRRR